MYKHNKIPYLFFIISFVSLLVVAYYFETWAVDPRVLVVPQGGTGFSSTSPRSIIVSGATASSSLVATSSEPLYVGSLTATTTTASSTFRVVVVSQAGFQIDDYVSCTALETDASGFIQCGSDGSSFTYPFTPTDHFGLT